MLTLQEAIAKKMEDPEFKTEWDAQKGLTDTHEMCIMRSTGGKDMKTKDFIALLERNGWKLKRHGANHDIYTKNGQRESVPRHRELDEELARAIIKRRGLK